MPSPAACRKTLFLCCALAACGNPAPQPDARANGAAAAAPPVLANAEAAKPVPGAAPAPAPAPAATGNAAAPAPAAEDEGTGGRELAEGSANLDFIIVNHTGQTITALSISPHGEESWTPDILVPRDVPSDERGAASFSRDVEICSWDVRATYEGGHRQSWPGVNLCDTVRVELR
jgi:hypothetical protein